jgi:uncharacterized protein YjbI with pentapeptide repeats
VRQRRRVEPPRLPSSLAPAGPLRLDDELVLDGVEVVGSDVDDDADGARHVEVLSSRLRGVRLTASTLERARFVDVVLDDCDLSGVSLTDSSFVRVQLRNCRLSGLQAPGLRASDVLVTDAKAEGVNLRMANVERSAFVRCALAELDAGSATLTDVDIVGCDLSRADFHHARLANVALHGSTVDGVRGGASLAGAVVGSDQLVSLALATFDAIGIVVDDEHRALEVRDDVR